MIRKLSEYRDSKYLIAEDDERNNHKNAHNQETESLLIETRAGFNDNVIFIIRATLYAPKAPRKPSRNRVTVRSGENAWELDSIYNRHAFLWTQYPIWWTRRWRSRRRRRDGWRCLVLFAVAVAQPIVIRDGFDFKTTSWSFNHSKQKKRQNVNKQPDIRQIEKDEDEQRKWNIVTSDLEQ